MNVKALFLSLMRSHSVSLPYRMHFVAPLSCVSCAVLSYPPMSSLVLSSVFSQLYSSNWGHTSFLKSSGRFSSVRLRRVFQLGLVKVFVPLSSSIFPRRHLAPVPPASVFIPPPQSVPSVSALSLCRSLGPFLSLSPLLSLLKRNYCAALVSG